MTHSSLITIAIATTALFTLGCQSDNSGSAGSDPDSASPNSGEPASGSADGDSTTRPGSSAETGGDDNTGDGDGGDGDGDGDDSPAAMLCSEECAYAGDGECDDGGDGAISDACFLGTDCADCGERVDTGEVLGGPVGEAACGDGDAGRALGSLAENFTLLSQEGKEVSLSDYCGKVVYIPMGAMWCPACQSTAEEIPQTMATYGGSGLVVLNLMAETARGATPDQEALSTWADTYDLVTPVLADSDWGVWERYFPSHSTPKELLIGRDGTLLEIGWVGTRSIESALE